MTIKLIFEDEIIHIVCAYAPQISLLETDKILFLKNLQTLIQQIPKKENILHCGDFNGYIGIDNVGFEFVQEGI